MMVWLAVCIYAAILFARTPSILGAAFLNLATLYPGSVFFFGGVAAVFGLQEIYWHTVTRGRGSLQRWARRRLETL